MYIFSLKILSEYWIICATLAAAAAACLITWCFNGFIRTSSHKKPTTHQLSPRDQPIDSALHSASLTNFMSYPHQVRLSKKSAISAPQLRSKVRQPFDAFLILDVEATCQRGTDFNFPNEIIEFPVCLMKWQDRSDDNRASHLEVVGEFRSFVKPTWRPTLSDFCKDLTGITQKQVDSAPPFPAVMEAFQKFIVKHGLLDEDGGARLVRFCWCSDGPFDVRDFVVKQCFISKMPMPSWFQGDVLDIRTTVLEWLLATQTAETPGGIPAAQGRDGPSRRSLNIPAQLKALGLPGFEGRQHSGIDDSRNLTKIVAELARRGVCLKPNTVIRPNKRWQWMGKHGQIMEYFGTS